MPIDYMKPIRKVCGLVMGRGGKVSPLIAEARLKICMRCPHLRPRLKTCALCGCFVQEKVLFNGSQCDIGA